MCFSAASARVLCLNLRDFALHTAYIVAKTVRQSLQECGELALIAVLKGSAVRSSRNARSWQR
jgi:hypothetical protein